MGDFSNNKTPMQRYQDLVTKNEARILAYKEDIDKLYDLIDDKLDSDDPEVYKEIPGIQVRAEELAG